MRASFEEENNVKLSVKITDQMSPNHVFKIDVRTEQPMMSTANEPKLAEWSMKFQKLEDCGHWSSSIFKNDFISDGDLASYLNDGTLSLIVTVFMKNVKIINSCK
jgi:hypothetical protein